MYFVSLIGALITTLGVGALVLPFVPQGDEPAPGASVGSVVAGVVMVVAGAALFLWAKRRHEQATGTGSETRLGGFLSWISAIALVAAVVAFSSGHVVAGIVALAVTVGFFLLYVRADRR